MQRTLVVGTGSIGRRHVDNLLALGASVAAFSHRGGANAAALPAGADHRRSYSAERKAGGGVVFDLTHELDLLAWLLGEVTAVSAFLRHEPSLEIETEAIAHISLRFATGALAQVSLDYFPGGASA